MAKRGLVVVESPTKVKTIAKYLDGKYVVKASMGHVRDLPKSQLGVDPKKKFKPKYVVTPAKKKVLDELKKAAEKADTLYVATDPDREGEAIGWHLAQELSIAEEERLPHHLQRDHRAGGAGGVREPGPHRHQEGRRPAGPPRARPAGRLQPSPLLWDKIRRGLSAGRVQSVAVRLIVDREREIQAFVPVEYWSLHARLKAEAAAGVHRHAARGGRREGRRWPTRRPRARSMARLDGARFLVRSVTRGERKRNPAPPFITSTLQQDAGRKLGFSAKKTMTVAQQLYEGVEVGADGPVGLITYMRTDSVRIAAEAQAEARRG